MFAGLTLATSRAEMVRAVAEGVAAAVTGLVRAAEADLGQAFDRLRVDGGLTRSRTLMQAQADLLRIPIEVHPTMHATARGVASFARLGAGDVAGGMALAAGHGPVEIHTPRASEDEATTRFTRWAAAAAAAMDLAGKPDS